MTLTDTLKLISTAIPPQLISPAYMSHIEQVARRLPGGLTNFFGFESRLGDETPQADFLLYLTPIEGGRDIMAGTTPASAVLDPLLVNPVWGRLRQFCQQWAEPTSALHTSVRDLWLEFDINHPPLDLPVPSCFFRPHLAAGDTGDWITAAAIPLLRGQALPASVEQKILACLAELPGGAYVFQVGLMLARPTDAVRLCIRDIAPDQILPYLTRLGWSGPGGPLTGLIANLSRYVDRLDLNLDVTQTVLPKLGLECYFSNLRQPKAEPRWFTFLNFLVSSGLCQPAKREGLLAYSGYQRHQSMALWSDHLRLTAGLLDSHAESIIFRGLHHIKLVYQPEHALEAKAYFYVSRTLLSQELIKQLPAAPVRL